MGALELSNVAAKSALHGYGALESAHASQQTFPYPTVQHFLESLGILSGPRNCKPLSRPNSVGD